MSMEIDIRPTWAELGMLYARLAESGETKAVAKLRVELAQATALAQAFSAIQPTLSEQQKEIAKKTMSDALSLQGY